MGRWKRCSRLQGDGLCPRSYERWSTNSAIVGSLSTTTGLPCSLSSEDILCPSPTSAIQRPRNCRFITSAHHGPVRSVCIMGRPHDCQHRSRQTRSVQIRIAGWSIHTHQRLPGRRQEHLFIFLVNTIVHSYSEPRWCGGQVSGPAQHGRGLDLRHLSSSSDEANSVRVTYPLSVAQILPGARIAGHVLPMSDTFVHTCPRGPASPSASTSSLRRRPVSAH